MKCSFCAKTVHDKDRTRIEYRSVQPGFRTSPLLFADGLPGADGPLSAACGPLYAVLHRKCYLARKRRVQLRSADASAQSMDIAEELSEGNGDR